MDYGVGIVVVIGSLGAANLGLPQVRRPTLIAGELTLLVALPLWGLVLDLTSPNCDPCDDPSRPIGLPGLWVVFANFVWAMTQRYPDLASVPHVGPYFRSLGDPDWFMGTF
ncbi:MAG: hypothetical protein H6738_08800 [Alphaproteobacteria bacterium]|nr:hypothetical protein [Alphaproteobacteria bacterium]MCB9696859.1 hypothetical protein [Alphaproteobacteria bacterium]